MMFACHYAIVRFVPFAETDEFANVGVILFSPSARFFSFRLMKAKHARITNFFSELDGKVYRNVMRNAQDELQRIAQEFKSAGTDKRLRALDSSTAYALWSELTKPLASVLRTSEARLVMATNPQQKLLDLYGYYVERSFVTREYQDEILIRSVKGVLREAGVADRFHHMKVGSDEYHATFPFVATQNERPTQIIKPLNLSQDEPTKVLDHGFTWIHRLKTLKRKNLLPADVLVAVGVPQPRISEQQLEAREEVLSGLAEIEVLTKSVNDTAALREFALRVSVHDGDSEVQPAIIWQR